MRLWHYALIPYLDRQHLLSQHRECCALRGNGWLKKHATVNYVFDHAPNVLYHYHCKVMKEMVKRGYSIDEKWLDPLYRGKDCKPWTIDECSKESYNYPEHNVAYLAFCIDHLEQKGCDVSEMRNKLLTWRNEE